MPSPPDPPTRAQNRERAPWRRHGGIAGGYLGLALGLAGLWILLGHGEEALGLVLVFGGAAVVVVAGVALWDRAFGVPLLIGPPAAAVLLLVRYATAGPSNRELGWAIAAGIVLLVAVGMIALARHGVRKMDREQALERDGIPALAEVLAIRETGRFSGLSPQVVLEVELSPEDGRPYRAQSRLYVSPVKIPRPGDVLEAKIDPADPARWSVDLEPDHWRERLPERQP